MTKGYLIHHTTCLRRGNKARGFHPPIIIEELEEILPPDFNDFLRERAYVAENQRPDYKS